MAIKDQATLDKVNHLHDNLEQSRAEEITNVWDKLFWVLEWSNNISVDNEIYSSIRNISRSTNLTDRINAITFDPQLTVNGVSIVNTNGLPHSDSTETENSKNLINQSINDLGSLEGRVIQSLHTRFQENIEVLTDIRDAQNIFTGTPRGTHTISNALSAENGLRNRINSIRTIINSIISEFNRHWWPRVDRLNSLRENFENADKTGIPDRLRDIDINTHDSVKDLSRDYGNFLRNTETRIWELNNERNLRSLIDRLANREILIPNWFLPFTSINTIASAWWNAADTERIITAFNNRLTELNNFETQISSIRSRYQSNLSKLDKILQLQKLQEKLNATELSRRQNEFQTINDICNNNLWLWEVTYIPELPNQTINIWWTLWPIHLDFISWTLWAWRNASYSLCDSTWNPLRNNWWRLEIQQWWQTINIWWIRFDDAAQTMTFDRVTVTPIENIAFPLILDLNVRVRIHDNATWLNIDHHKPIHLEITKPTLSTGDREHAYDSLTPPMNERVAAEYSNHYREDIENNQIWKILREWWNEAEVNEIYNNPSRKAILENRMRALLHIHFPNSSLILRDLQTGFKNSICDEHKNVPPQYLLNETTFADYVRNNFPNNLKTYAEGTIYRNINTIRTEVLQELIKFQSDVAHNKVDNLDNLRALAAVPNDANWPQWHPNSRRQRLTNHRSNKNNYTKFFQWRSAELNDLKLDTEDGEIKYWVHVEVSGVNRITATITIDWKEEPEVIDAANHDRLIKWILNRAQTKDWEPLNRKLRCNIALSVLKAMVMMSPTTLRREIPPRDFTTPQWETIRCNRLEADIHDWNLRIRGGAVNPHWHIRSNAELFNESSFKSLHDWNMLETWILQLSTQINSIMNATANEYNEATNRIIRNKELREYDTKQFLEFWPVKRLRWRIRYWKTNNDFNFSTSVNAAWKSTNINFEKWKFTVSWDFEWQAYNYKAKDLWSILRKKINRKRVFDGIELAMIWAINEEYVQKLRTNNLIQTENFAVADTNNNKTWRIYIFDEWWNLSYLEIEDRALSPLHGRNAGMIRAEDIPVERIRCNDKERQEFFQNPFLAWRLLREMRRRLALF